MVSAKSTKASNNKQSLNKADYLIISRPRRREYLRIVTETKSRWLFNDIHVAWGD